MKTLETFSLYRLRSLLVAQAVSDGSSCGIYKPKDYVLREWTLSLDTKGAMSQTSARLHLL
ncbi:MAG TPA: hypothetical protein VMU57_02750 [Edaphobacter sp.]|uniref:hypothetical protein n=1 Tax=Edaphobacter sp. TaxID=1934404 RepID=UPI002C3654D5|nr:hypothetical protein [Edaphobacter sp.]HUZ93809.1 hypothetical protein [Edaphobacter sp.]